MDACLKIKNTVKGYGAPAAAVSFSFIAARLLAKLIERKLKTTSFGAAVITAVIADFALIQFKKRVYKNYMYIAGATAPVIIEILSKGFLKNEN